MAAWNEMVILLAFLYGASSLLSNGIPGELYVALWDGGNFVGGPIRCILSNGSGGLCAPGCGAGGKE